MGVKMTCRKACWWVWMTVWMSVAPANPVNTTTDKLLFILMDGLRWDYVDMQNASMLPGFNRILDEGVRAKWTEPLFPALSHPTWTTLVTGRYAEVHNVVGNFYYDAATKEKFLYAQWDKPWSSEPIWTTAEKAGLRTAQIQVSGCNVPIQGIETQFCYHYYQEPLLSFQTSLEMALQKFEEGFDFVQVYNPDMDSAGHGHVDNSEVINKAMRDLDDPLKEFLAALENRGLLDHVNIVMVSDHGMTSTAPGTVTTYEIDDYLDTDLVENLADFGSFINIKVKEGKVDEVYAQLSKIPSVKVYKHDDIPDRYHYRDSPFIYEIILVAEKGTFVMPSRSEKQFPTRRTDHVAHGNHGYDPNEQDMKGIFFARGPAFASGSVVEPIYIVDIYQVLTHVLSISGPPHNGTWSHVQPVFTTDDKGRIYGDKDFGKP